MRKIAWTERDALFAALSARIKLYIPADTDGGAQFLPWQPGMRLSGALNTVRSAKDFFFPQTEELMRFRIDGKKIELIDTRAEGEDFAVFGVRACDARAFRVLDNVFLKEPADTYYQNRRTHGVLFTLACDRPAETCFCTAFGIDAAAPEGDVRCWKTDDTLYLDAVTEKGEALLAGLDVLTDCDGAAVAAAQQTIRERLAQLPLQNLPVGRFGAGKTAEFFDAPAWAELSETCLGCGTCTYVCPTCQCYDIRDFDTGHGVQRYRCWDSCMYSEFTKMSAGQPRLTQKERFRQRFMHKLVYYPENNEGLFSCVGCGRCLQKCPIQTNIVKVMRKLTEGGDDRG